MNRDPPPAPPGGHVRPSPKHSPPPEPPRAPLLQAPAGLKRPGASGGYGLPGGVVDGNDVVAVYAAAGAAVERARQGGGPTLIECRTYRTRAHAEGMRDAGYRTQDEVSEWRARDP